MLSAWAVRAPVTGTWKANFSLYCFQQSQRRRLGPLASVWAGWSIPGNRTGAKGSKEIERTQNGVLGKAHRTNGGWKERTHRFVELWRVQFAFKTQSQTKLVCQDAESNNHLLTHCCISCCHDHRERRESREIWNVCGTKNLYIVKQEEKTHNLSGSSRQWCLFSGYQNRVVVLWEGAMRGKLASTLKSVRNTYTEHIVSEYVTCLFSSSFRREWSVVILKASFPLFLIGHRL